MGSGKSNHEGSRRLLEASDALSQLSDLRFEAFHFCNLASAAGGTKLFLELLYFLQEAGFQGVAGVDPFRVGENIFPGRIEVDGEKVSRFRLEGHYAAIIRQGYVSN